MAAELGVTLEEARSEAGEIDKRCQVAGAVTIEETAVVGSTELGMSAAAVPAGTRAWLEVPA
jgi:hypothetical protein